MSAADVFPEPTGTRTLRRIVRTRRLWVLIGTLVGVVGAVGMLIVVPSTATVSALVNITAVTTDPAPQDRSASNLVDMSTEVQIARSSLTASRAAELLGAGWTTVELRESTEVTGDAEGTIVRISFTSADENEARRAADALAQAYLEVRTSLVRERVEAVAASIDAELSALRDQLRDALVDAQAAAEGSTERASALAQEDTLRTRIQTLSTRRASLYDITSDAGQVITPASDAVAWWAPSRRTVLLAGTAAGVVLGLALALVRQGLARHPSGPEEFSEILGVPVWSRDTGAEGVESWASAAQLGAFASEGSGRCGLLLEGTSPDAADVEGAFAAIGRQSRTGGSRGPRMEGVEVIDLDTTRAGVLRALSGVRVVVLAVSPRWRSEDLRQLVDQLAATGRILVGAVLVRGGEGR